MSWIYGKQDNCATRYIAELKKVEGKKISVTFITFSDSSSVVWNHRDISECSIIGTDEYHPGGGTALTDAIGNAIENMKSHIASAEVKPGKVSFFITTDGEENSSSQFTQQSVKQMIVAQTKQQGWDFIFAGANIDAFAAGNNYGILQDNCAQISNNGKAQSAIYSAVAKRAMMEECEMMACNL